MSKDSSSFTVAASVACIGDHDDFPPFLISLVYKHVHITSSQAGDYTVSYFKSLMMSACFPFDLSQNVTTRSNFPLLVTQPRHSAYIKLHVLSSLCSLTCVLCMFTITDNDLCTLIFLLWMFISKDLSTPIKNNIYPRWRSIISKVIVVTVVPYSSLVFFH